MKKLILSVAIATMILTVGYSQRVSEKKSKSKKAGTSMGEHKNANHQHHDYDAKGEDSEAGIQKNGATTPIIDAYLEIKNALVSDNQEEAAKAGTLLLTELSKFDKTKLTESQNKECLKIFDSAKAEATHIVKNPIEQQRKNFEALSADINHLIKLVGTDKTLYKDFCPMANEGKGASWLSELKDVKNPYFGSSMLNCGKVERQIN